MTAMSDYTTLKSTAASERVTLLRRLAVTMRDTCHTVDDCVALLLGVAGAEHEAEIRRAEALRPAARNRFRATASQRRDGE